MSPNMYNTCILHRHIYTLTQKKLKMRIIEGTDEREKLVEMNV